MPTKRKPLPVTSRKPKAQSGKPKGRNGAPPLPRGGITEARQLAKEFAEDEARLGYDFETWLRVMRAGRFPQGCTPAQKLAALKAHADLNGIKPVMDPETMMATFWPADESVDEFIAAIRGLRRQGK